MTAVSCLRVMVDANRTDLPAETLGPLVAKYATIFLEVRWVRPRTADQLSHYCYLLSDPRSDELDTVELAHLATELQERLFGTGVEDAVKLVLFEGELEAIRAFTASSAEEVLLAMEDPGRLPKGGRLRRIAADGSLIDVPEDARAPKGPVDDFIFGPSIDGAQGIYFPKARTFVGDVVSCTPSRAATYYSAVDGEEHLPDDSESFDGGCVMTALRFLLDFPVATPLYVPVSFSTLVRPTQRSGYVELLGILPAETRGQLAATVYDVPRAPSFQSLKIIHETLRGHFASLDLRTQDPDFEVRQLVEGTVTSVTLVLPNASQEVRTAALRRFASHIPEYKRRRIWSGLTNVRFRTERELAVSLGFPFLTGPGICRLQAEPVGGRSWDIDALPVLSLDRVLADAG
ncbi:hypothetical protein [Brevundimonas sp.]|uniref:hypothetical protein n=1 Tax=Brevundimonas sp. TaxID=1871086 RepID=UPI00286C90E2|nr:hypothetical protein [Brevundimonas sp.]